nr:hypothetical protein CFP56_60011 [Quercus suber]
MEAEYCNEPPRLSEEEDELGRSVKKFKESSGVKQFTPPRNLVSYKNSLVGDNPGAYKQAFKLDNVWDDGEESDIEVEPLIEGMAKVKLSKETKAGNKAPWSKALIVKVFGRTVGFNYLTFKLNALWKLATRMDCVNLGKDYFLIKFYCSDDYDKVLRGGPWFIGSAIGLVLRIDSYTAIGSCGSYARLCIQIDLEKPLIKSIRIGRLVQQVKYEGISSLWFCYGRLGHKQENCCYKIKKSERSDRSESEAEKSPNQASEEDKQSDPNFGPWILVTRKKNSIRNGQSRFPLGSDHKGDVSPKGIFFQRKKNYEGGSVKSNNEKVLSIHSNPTHARCEVFVLGVALNGDLGNPKGLDAQSLVELYNRHSTTIMGGGRRFEQAEKAVGGASLRRIRMGDTGKEISGQEGNGNNINGEPPNAEAYSNSCSGREVRYANML